MKKILFVGDDSVCIITKYLGLQMGFESDSATICKDVSISKAQLRVIDGYGIDSRICGKPDLLFTKQRIEYDYIIALKPYLVEKIKHFIGEVILWDIHYDKTTEGFRFIGKEIQNRLKELSNPNIMDTRGTTKQLKVAIVLGTRPEIIKLAPLIKKFKNLTLYHTNQHYDRNMDINFFKELSLSTDFVRYNKPFQLEYVIQWLTNQFKLNMPDVVIVLGDTNSVLAGGIAAKQLGIKVAHMEAGLRSRDSRMTEEQVRIIIDHLSDYLFTPTTESVTNLIEEGIDKSKIFNVGNTIVDMVKEYKDKSPKDLLDIPTKYILLTMHRAENVDNKNTLTDLVKAIEQVISKFKIPIIYPIHPRTKKRLTEFKLFTRFKQIKGLKIIQPVSFVQMLNLEKGAKIVINDSGSLQEELCILGVPCITIRKTTERPETVSCKANLVVGTNPLDIINAVDYWLKKKRFKWIQPYGKDVSNKIVTKLNLELNNHKKVKTDSKVTIQTILGKNVIGELLPKKDIIIFGTLAPWEIMGGQRIAQIIQYWIEDGHRILYIEPYKSKSYEKYETDNFKLYCLGENGNWNWWQNQSDLKKNLHQRKKELCNVIDNWLIPGYQPTVIYEMPLPDYVELLDIFIERNFKIIYELIDKWDKMYLGDKIRIPHIEKYLVDRSDILIGSSTLLVKELMKISGIHNRTEQIHCRQDIQLIPNAHNPELFNPDNAGKMPIDMQNCLKDNDYEKIVFYMGPVQCEWFDWQNYLKLLKTYPNYKFVCIGWNCERDNFTNKDYAKLQECKNYAFLGRKTHKECLNYVYHSDICIIPFRDIPMIHATSPNKLFEYLACYKPIINVYSKDFDNYPNMSLVKNGSWVTAVENAITMKIDKEKIDKFLIKNTWKDRADRILNCYTCHHKELSEIESHKPIIWSPARVGEPIETNKKCSLIMLNFNTPEYTEEAVNSIKHHTSYPHELIVVDNGSHDNSIEVLQRLVKCGMIDKLILPKKNLGFSGGNNLGLKSADNEYIGFINSDVIVSPNWLTKLVKVLEDDGKVGAVGPVSNNVGGINFPQRVKFINEKEGIVKEIPRLSGFCVLFPKKVLDEIGNWDEQFFPGFFEDDDICVRLYEAGYKLKYCGNSFIHHKMQSTFTKNKIDSNTIHNKNKKRFEQKWKGKYPPTIKY